MKGLWVKGIRGSKGKAGIRKVAWRFEGRPCYGEER
jgi:hypothetical protein